MEINKYYCSKLKFQTRIIIPIKKPVLIFVKYYFGIAVGRTNGNERIIANATKNFEIQKEKMHECIGMNIDAEMSCSV